jgi:predicted enzyme related to lactoylglutathione lyase
MAEFNIPAPGSVCWRELRTKDLDAATEFYSKMFGWTLDQSKLTPTPYKEIVIDGKAEGGMMAIDENWPPGVPSHWASYISVENADETVEKIKANGGSITVPPFDAPGVGRMVMVADPAGAAFAVIQLEKPA